MFDDVIRDAEESKWGSHDHSLWVITIRHSRCSLEGCSVNNRSFAECAGDSSSWSHTTIVHVHESMFAFTQRCSHNNCSRSHDDVLTTIVHVHMTMFTRRCSHDDVHTTMVPVHMAMVHIHTTMAPVHRPMFTVMGRLRSCNVYGHATISHIHYSVFTRRMFSRDVGGSVLGCSSCGHRIDRCGTIFSKWGCVWGTEDRRIINPGIKGG